MKKKADTMIRNAKIYTMAEEGQTAQCLVMRDGFFCYVGDEAGALEYSCSKTLDMDGKTILPGLGDSHLHLYAYCQNQTTVPLEETRSINQLKEVLMEKAGETSEGKWIKGTGFDQTKFEENRMPCSKDLDEVSGQHPIVIRRCCLHVMIANHKAMELAGITKEMAEASGGLIELDKEGNLTGIFREAATQVFDDIVPDPLEDPALKKEILVRVLKSMAARGVTSIHTFAAHIWNYYEDLETYQMLQEEGLLPIRVQVSLDTFFQPSPEEKRQDPRERVRSGAYKIFTDGSLGSRSAALREEYSDDPGNYGVMPDPEELREKLEECLVRNLQPAIHAIGDKALDITLDAIEALLEKHPLPEKEEGSLTKIDSRLPIRLIHAQFTRPDQIRRMKALPVALDVQPVFLMTDLHWIEDRLGKERINHTYLWRTLMEEGLILTGGSDCPVETWDPFMGIYAAVTRQDPEGNPPGGWKPDERVSIYQAISMFTKNIPIASREQEWMGTIETGKFGDWVVLDQDPFQIPAERLKDIRVLRTFVGGEQVFCLEEGC